MKQSIFNKFFLALVMLLGIISCDDRELITVENSGAPIVMDLSTDKIFLDQNFPENPVLTVNWEPAKYSVPVEVKYRVEVSKTEDFKTPVTLATVSGSESVTSFTVSQMNKAAGDIGLVPDVAQKMFVRVVSYLGNDSLASISNVTPLTITPYVVIIDYPDFYLVGEASAIGWSETKAILLFQTEYKNTIYTYLEKGKNFRFLGQKAWNPINYSIDASATKDGYKYFKSVSDNIAKSAGDDENMTFSGESGIYKIVIDATEGKHTLMATASSIPTYNFTEIYLVGSVAGNDWNAGNAIPMAKVSDGVYEYTTTIADGAEFKFLGQKDWGNLEWGNIMKDNAGNTGFLGPKGDNGNVKFNGGGKSYTISVNIKAGTYTIK